MSFSNALIGDLTKIRTGKLDANAAVQGGAYPFFTCAVEPLSIDRYAYDCDAILIAGNGDLNVKHFKGKFEAYQRTYIIEVEDNAKLDSRYFYYFMLKYVEKLRELSIGGVIKYIKLEMLTDAEIPLPPLEQQKRIAAILDKADAIRRKRQHAIKLADNFLRSTFLDMFGDPATNPKGWNIEALGEHCEEMRYGTSIKCSSSKKENSLPVLRIPNIAKEKVNYDNLVFANLPKQERAVLTLINGDLLFVRTNGNPDYIGRCAVFENHEDIIYASYLIRARLKKDCMLLPDYVQACISSKSYRKIIIKEAKTTAGNYNVNTQGLKGLKIPLAPIEMQMKFSEIRKLAEKQLEKKCLGVSQSENLFNSLSQRAFRGKL